MSADEERASASPDTYESHGRTETAAVVAAVWCELFRVARIDPDDDFFTLGGDSMLAVRISARLRTELGLRVPVRTIMENPTVDGLAQLLAQALWSATD